MGVPQAMTDYVASLGVSTLGLILVLVVFYLVLGCFIETLSMMVGTIPIVFPIILYAGIDPVWFGIFLVLMMELALITPPVGMNLYVVQGIRGRGTVSDLFSRHPALRRGHRHLRRGHHRVSGACHVAPGTDVPMRLLIVNPNTSRATNGRIRAIAAPLVREPDELEVLSAPSGIDLIESVAQSVATIPAVLSVVDERHAQVDAIIIAAFSDPGLSDARQAASCPVFGISRVGHEDRRSHGGTASPSSR